MAEHVKFGSASGVECCDSVNREIEDDGVNHKEQLKKVCHMDRMSSVESDQNGDECNKTFVCADILTEKDVYELPPDETEADKDEKSSVFSVEQCGLVNPESNNRSNSCELSQESVCVSSFGKIVHDKDNITGSNTQSSEYLTGPVNLSVLKNSGQEEDYSHVDLFKIRKRKHSSCSSSSGIETMSEKSVSTNLDDKFVNGNRDTQCCDSLCDSKCIKHSSIQILPATDSDKWESSSCIYPANSRTDVVSDIDEPLVETHAEYHSFYPSNIGEEFSSTFSSPPMNNYPWKVNSQMCVNSTVRPPEIVSEKVAACCCNECWIASSNSCVKQFYERENFQKNCCESGSRALSETIINQGNLFKKIEESLAETENIKSQEKMLLRRIAKSLHEAEFLKCRGEEVLKKIEYSLTEAETLKTREEELLRKIEISLAHKQIDNLSNYNPYNNVSDEELLTMVEETLKSSSYNEDVSKICSAGNEYQDELDCSLPLKKRKKRLKLLHISESCKLKAESKTAEVKSFPSFPSAPMMSVAEVLDKLPPTNFSKEAFSFRTEKNVPFFSSGGGFEKLDSTNLSTFWKMSNQLPQDRIKREESMVFQFGPEKIQSNCVSKLGDALSNCNLSQKVPVCQEINLGNSREENLNIQYKKQECVQTEESSKPLFAAAKPCNDHIKLSSSEGVKSRLKYKKMLRDCFESTGTTFACNREQKSSECCLEISSSDSLESHYQTSANSQIKREPYSADIPERSFDQLNASVVYNSADMVAKSFKERRTDEKVELSANIKRECTQIIEQSIEGNPDLETAARKKSSNKSKHSTYSLNNVDTSIIGNKHLDDMNDKGECKVEIKVEPV